MPKRHASQRLPNFTKRRGKTERWEMVDTARRKTHLLYCEVLELWRRCATKRCARSRCCTGEPYICLRRGARGMPPEEIAAAQAQVVKGGPRRVAPLHHDEWTLRRAPLPDLLLLNPKSPSPASDGGGDPQSD